MIQYFKNFMNKLEQKRILSERIALDETISEVGIEANLLFHSRMPGTVDIENVIGDIAKTVRDFSSQSESEIRCGIVRNKSFQSFLKEQRPLLIPKFRIEKIRSLMRRFIDPNLIETIKAEDAIAAKLINDYFMNEQRLHEVDLSAAVKTFSLFEDIRAAESSAFSALRYLSFTELEVRGQKLRLEDGTPIVPWSDFATTRIRLMSGSKESYYGFSLRVKTRQSDAAIGQMQHHFSRLPLALVSMVMGKVGFDEFELIATGNYSAVPKEFKKIAHEIIERDPSASAVISRFDPSGRRDAEAHIGKSKPGTCYVTPKAHESGGELKVEMLGRVEVYK